MQGVCTSPARLWPHSAPSIPPTCASGLLQLFWTAYHRPASDFRSAAFPSALPASLLAKTSRMILKILTEVTMHAVFMQRLGRHCRTPAELAAGRRAGFCQSAGTHSHDSSRDQLLCPSRVLVKLPGLQWSQALASKRIAGCGA
jgi:hypothetical protein